VFTFYVSRFTRHAPRTTFMQRTVEKEWLDELPANDPRAARSRRDIQRLNLLTGHDQIMAEVLNNVFQAGRPRRLVELGAGNGQFFLSVARRLGGAWRDVDARLVDRVDGFDPQIRDEFKALHWNVRLEIADARSYLRQSAAGSNETGSETLANFSGERSADSHVRANPMTETRGQSCPRSDKRSPAKTSEVVMANQFFHQFASDALREMFRDAADVADVLIAVEPRRGFWPLLCSRLVLLAGCGAVTRFDAPVSVRAGFNGDELSALWPDQKNWQLTERRAGLFSHLFIARRTS